MRVLVYEWSSGGGLLSGGDPSLRGLLGEGRAMLAAACKDLAGLAGVCVVALVDSALSKDQYPDGQAVVVSGAAQHEAELTRLLRESDAVLLVAPEIGGTLLRVAALAESLGANLVSPPSAFIAVAGSKHRTLKRLAEAGLPAAPGVFIARGDRPPRDLPLPVIAKPDDGAGSLGCVALDRRAELDRVCGVDRWAGPLLPGRSASVGVLCGGPMPVPMPACWQHISRDGRFRYLGGETIAERALAQRAEGLAAQAVAVMPACRGYVGVDLLLGDDPSGRRDALLEINPRMTASACVLRESIVENPAQLMLAAAAGRPVVATPTGDWLRFTSEGVVTARSSRAGHG